MVSNKKFPTKNSIPLNIIGISDSGVEGLSSHLQKIILSAKKIAAPKRTFVSFTNWWKRNNPHNPLPELFATEQTNKLIDWLIKRDQKTVLLASGDPLWFGIGRTLLSHFNSEELIFHPSPTSLQLAFSKIKKPWQDTCWVSLHGRDVNPLIDLLKKTPNSIGILTDPKQGGAQQVRDILHAYALETIYKFWIFEKLGAKEERVYEINSQEKLPLLDPLHLVVLIKENKNSKNFKNIPLFGIEDSFYSTYEDRPSLITKKEIRIQILANLELPKQGIIWDIGAGVGSIGLEALRIRPELKLLAIEKRLGGKKLINENAKRLSVHPSKVIEDDAISLFKSGKIPKNLSKPNRIIISGGNFEKSSLQQISNRLEPEGIIVIPLATLEKLEQISLILKKEGFNVQISQHHAFRGIPLKDGTRLSPINPIFIIKAKL